MLQLKGKITMVNGALPATAILHSYADESYVGTANINRDGVFTFQVDVPRAGLFNLRIMRLNYDLMVSVAEKGTMVDIAMDGDQVKDFKVENSPENDAYSAFKMLTTVYDPKLRLNFMYCDKTDSCEKELHSLLTEYAHELSIVQDKYKGTYTGDVLCSMRMPFVAKSVKNTSAEFRKNFFEKVDFSDSTIFSTIVFKDMINAYVDYLIEPRISRYDEFIKYFTDKIKLNPVVLHKSAGLMFDGLFGRQREKMLAMFIAWYNNGDNKKSVNNPVLEVRAKNISRVMPGETYIDVMAPDPDGTQRSLKDVVSRSKCTLLLFWSSECPHCRDEMPVIKEYYQKYHSKGFDVYGVSLEPDSVKWKNYVQAQNLPWTNVISDHRSDPNPAMQYVSTSTPTLVLIDSKGTILHRFMPKNKIEDHILEALK